MNVTAIPFLFLAVGLLGFVAIGVIVQVVLSSQKEKLTLKSLFQGFLTLVWVLPLAGVLGYFGLKVAPGFEQPEPPNLEASLVIFHDTDEGAKDDSAAPRYGDNVEEWVKIDAKHTEKGYLIVVTSGPEAELEEARNEAFENAVKQIEAYYALDKRYYGPIGITKEDVEKVRKKEYIEIIPQGNPGFEYNMHRVHWQIALTPELSDSFVSRAKVNVSKSRIWTLGSVLAVCTLLLFGFSSYLRLDTQTEGRYRNRLKFATISFMAVGCLAIAEFFRLG